jgi:hypothetical protein
VNDVVVSVFPVVADRAADPGVYVSEFGNGGLVKLGLVGVDQAGSPSLDVQVLEQILVVWAVGVRSRHAAAKWLVDVPVLISAQHAHIIDNCI